MPKSVTILFFVAIIGLIFTKRHKVIVENNKQTYEASETTFHVPQFLVPSELGTGPIESELPEVGKIATLEALHSKYKTTYSVCDTYHPTEQNSNYVTGVIVRVE
ncbi:MAG: hypothetical protein NTY80_01040 [candidate division SR1 bacterium]|nr:hypothetical protein [candidate division SR1 bacterium]